MSKWPIVPLGEVLSQYRGYIEAPEAKIYPKLSVKLYGKGVALDAPADGTSLKMKRHQLAKAGQVILSEIWGKKGAIGFVPPEGEGALCTSHFFLFDVNSEKLLPKWLEYIFRANYLQEQLDFEAKGTTGYAAVRPVHLLKATIPLPPLSEQRRLVERIDALAAKIEEAKQLRSEADSERHQLPHQAAAAIFLENAWPHLVLKELLIEDSRNGIGTRPNNEPPGVPILRISAGTSRSDAVVDEDDYKYLTITKKQMELYRLRKDDLLACRFNGNLHFVGRFSIYRRESGLDQVYPDKLIRFRVDSSRVLPDFVKLAMNSPVGRERIECFCTTTAGNIGISATELKTIPVPVPPLEVQQTIVDHLQGIQQEIEASEGEADGVKRKLNALLPSILDRAFRGEL